MRISPRRRLVMAVTVTGALLGSLVLATTAFAGRTAAATSRQVAFAAAAREFAVPLSVLMATSYGQTRWESHAGLQSTAGGYGPMHLTEVPSAQRQEPDEQTGRLRQVPDSPGLHTLSTAAGLLHTSPESLRTSDVANIRGGAALLAHYARQHNGGALPATTGGWYAAVATYANPDDPTSGRDFADSVYATVASGASRATDDSQQLASAPDPAVRPDTASVPATPHGDAPPAECPADLACSYLPTYYGERGGPSNTNKTDYCSYNVAKRPTDIPIQYVVMHDTEEFYDDVLKRTQHTTSCVSFPYLIRSSDGHVAQTVPTSVVAWHAGNYWLNMHSIGIEQEGFLIQGPTWYSEPLYRSAARLLRYLSGRFGIPLDRGHVLGHDTVPSPTDKAVQGQHVDPGVAYDWSHVFDLAGAPIVPSGSPSGEVVTIRPNYHTNTVVVSGCQPPQFGSPATCRNRAATNLPAMSSSDVFLHTAPTEDAPLIPDPHLAQWIAGNGSDGLVYENISGTNRAENWGSRVSTGQQFVVCDRRAGWKAIWYGGQKAWFVDTPARPTTVPSSGRLVTPKSGKPSAAVYGEALPRPAEVPADPNVQAYVTSHWVGPLAQYAIPAGQRYVLVGPAVTDLYFAWYIDGSARYDRTDLHGADRYYWIFFNHRMAMVRADDVDAVPARPF